MCGRLERRGGGKGVGGGGGVVAWVVTDLAPTDLGEACSVQPL